jgi:hypothetical protein
MAAFVTTWIPKTKVNYLTKVGREGGNGAGGTAYYTVAEFYRIELVWEHHVLYPGPFIFMLCWGRQTLICF